VHYNATNNYPVVGDWTGGVTTIGVFNPTNGQFQLRNSNTPGAADETFVLGIADDQPFTGHWQAGAIHDGVGVFRPSNGLIYLKNELSTGFADVNIVYGIPNDIPVAGHWGISSPAPHNSLIVPNTALPANATATPTYPSIRLTQLGNYDG